MIDDFAFLLIVFVVSLVVFVGGCDHILLKLVNEDEIALRKKVNDLELRIYRIEQKGKVAK